MSFIILIPARYGSKRLPGKPLLDIGGKTLIERVYTRACKSESDSVYIVTDHTSIADQAKSFNAQVVETSSNHSSGTDRLAEAANILNLEKNNIVVNVQGDEPFIDPQDINNLAELIGRKKEADIATLFSEITEEQKDDPNIVKLWIDSNNNIKGFSRNKDKIERLDLKVYRHIGIYAYRVGFLKEFVSLSRTQGEISENLEQLRALENNKVIVGVSSTSKIHVGVDTQADLELARSKVHDD